MAYSYSPDDTLSDVPADIPAATSSASQDSGFFGKLMGTFGDIAGTAVNTFVPIVAQDYATKQKNKRDLEYTQALLQQIGGSKPNDPANALKEAQKTPAEKYTTNSILFANGKPTMLVWVGLGFALLVVLLLIRRR